MINTSIITEPESPLSQNAIHPNKDISLSEFIEAVQPVLRNTLIEFEFAKHYQAELMARFRTDEAIKFYESGAKTSELIEIFTARDNINRPVFMCAHELLPVISNGYSAAEVLSLLELHDDQGSKVFESIASDDFKSLYEKRYDTELILSIARLKNISSGEPVFKNLELITDIIDAGADLETLKRFVKIETPNGKGIFETGYQIERFLKAAGDPKIAELLLAIKDHSQRPVFQKASEIISFLNKGGTVSSAEKWISLSDPWQRTVFRKAEDLNTFIGSEGTLEEALKYSYIRNSSGDLAFNGADIAILKSQGVNLKTAELYAQKNLNSQTAVLYEQLNIGNTDFQNDGRPKFLLIQPTHDPELNFGSVFLGIEEIMFLSNFSRVYDMKMRAVSRVSDMITAIDTPEDLSLLFISGHGSPDSLTLGAGNATYDIEITPEEAKLTTSSNSVSEVLQRLPENSTVFLNSCTTAEGQFKKANLANFIAGMNPTVKLFASQIPFNFGKLVLQSVYPLNLAVYDGNKDHTYVTQHGEQLRVNHEYPALFGDAYSEYNISASTVLPVTEVRERLEELRKGIGYNSYPCFYPDEIQEVFDKFETVPGVEIVEKGDALLDKFYTPAQYAFGVIYQQDWCPVRDHFFGYSPVYKDTEEFFLRLGFLPVNEPREGDLVVYSNRGELRYEAKAPTFFGVWHEGKVISKYQMGHVFKHPLEAVPVRFGNHINFFRKPDSWKVNLPVDPVENNK